jgi:DNA-binding response OmpR family regulator/nitrogen-specific signal transduction histidine kinase/predicted Ser/Thr protein kinase
MRFVKLTGQGLMLRQRTKKMLDRLYVLLVETNQDDADLIRELLVTDGQARFELECVPRLSDAFECVRQGCFDIVLLDLELSDSNGMETFRAMRKVAGTDIPIVVLTGNNDESMGLAAIQEGAQDYIIKGQALGLLLARILCFSLGRHLATQRLLKSEQFLRSVLDSLSSGIAILDNSGVILKVNCAWRQFERLNGASACAVCEGINYLELCDNDRQGVLFAAGIRAVLSGEKDFFEMEYPCHGPDGQKWLHGTATRFLERDIPRVVVAYENITDRRQEDAEREKLKSLLFQSSKMEAVGQLAGGIAHDFSNMLSVINGYSELLLKEVPATDPKYARIREINRAGQSSMELVRQLLAFASKQAIAPKVLNLNYSMEDMLKMMRRLLGENIELQWKPAVNLWTVKIDPSQLDQVLTNLLVNARDAISGVGKVIIATYNANLDSDYCKTHPDFIPGEYVVLAISDTGCGMEKEALSHLFDPFFTTKDAGKGTGRGLTIVSGIVKQNSGFINVYSEIGLGTTFKIYLARNKSERKEDDVTPENSEILTGTETILLVEDETSLLCLVKMQLEQMGFTVIAADNPLQAIKLAEEYKGDIHLLMTDVVMPEMRGQDLGKALGAMRPGIKFLFMSGYTSDIIASNGVDFLAKPFSEEGLSAKLRKVLRHPSKEKIDKPLLSILAVDNEPEILQMLALSLTESGFTVDTASSASEALDKISSKQFEVVISDINMPDMSGLELLRAVRSKKNKTDFILITGLPDFKDAIIAIKEGAYDYLPKPLNLDALQGKIARLLLERKAGVHPRTGFDDIGKTKNGYSVIKCLGAGGAGTVLLVEKNDSYFAMKILSKSGTVPDDMVKKKIRKEAGILKSLNHDSVVKILEIGGLEDGETPYLVMEYVHGSSLASHLKDGSLSMEDKFSVMLQIASALDFIHSKKILHRDLKPENVLLTEAISVKIIDFGIAKVVDPSLTVTQILTGSPHYMDPEILKGNTRGDISSDIFSFGALSYELFTGIMPFSGSNIHNVMENVIYSKPPAPMSINPEIPEWLQDLMARMLDKNPGNRFSSVSDLIKVLTHYMANPEDFKAGQSLTNKLFRRILFKDAVWK